MIEGSAVVFVETDLRVFLVDAEDHPLVPVITRFPPYCSSCIGIVLRFWLLVISVCVVCPFEECAQPSRFRLLFWANEYVNNYIYQTIFLTISSHTMAHMTSMLASNRSAAFTSCGGSS
jgi:hypothetical protein